MGVWYFLILLLGISIIVIGVLKRSLKPLTKTGMLAVGICMGALSIYMFQDGSAETVDRLLKTFNINL